jgi:hypothetical protein
MTHPTAASRPLRSSPAGRQAGRHRDIILAREAERPGVHWAERPEGTATRLRGLLT